MQKPSIDEPKTSDGQAFTYRGFVIAQDDEIAPIKSADSLRELPADYATVWVDIERPKTGDMRLLQDVFDLDEEAIEDCLHGEQRPRIDEYKNCIFLIVYGLMSDSDISDAEPKKLAVFCSERFLLTIHAEPLRTLNRIHRRVKKRSAALRRGTDYLLYAIADELVDTYVSVVEEYEKTLETLEERSLEPSFDGTLLTDVGELRRDLVELRRVAIAQRSLFNPLAKGEFDFLSSNLEQRFSHVVSHLTHTVELVDGMRELLVGVVGNYHSHVAKETNDIVKTLTVYAAIMLPLSLVAGIYGMNVPLWPSPNGGHAFGFVVGLMAFIAVSSVYYFRSKRWL